MFIFLYVFRLTISFVLWYVCVFKVWRGLLGGFRGVGILIFVVFYMFSGYSVKSEVRSLRIWVLFRFFFLAVVFG